MAVAARVDRVMWAVSSREAAAAAAKRALVALGWARGDVEGGGSASWGAGATGSPGISRQSPLMCRLDCAAAAAAMRRGPCSAPSSVAGPLVTCQMRCGPTVLCCVGPGLSTVGCASCVCLGVGAPSPSGQRSWAGFGFLDKVGPRLPPPSSSCRSGDAAASGRLPPRRARCCVASSGGLLRRPAMVAL